MCSQCSCLNKKSYSRGQEASAFRVNTADRFAAAERLLPNVARKTTIGSRLTTNIVRKKPMTSNTVNVGMVGTSWWADAMHLPALDSHPDARTMAICGRNRENAQKMADIWKIPHVYTDYQDLIDNADLDAIVISTPNDSHYPITMAAFEAGLHVLCEKPIAMTYGQAREMADLAEQQEAQDIGALHLQLHADGALPKGVDRQRLFGRALSPQHALLQRICPCKGDYIWRLDRKIAGAGVVGDLGSHFMYLAEWFFGEVRAISCRLTRIVPRPTIDPQGEAYDLLDDSCMLTAEFANGAVGMIHATALCYEGTPFGQTHHMDFHGSDGTLYSYIDWDKIQQVRGARFAEGMPKELPIPDHIWGDARRDTVHNTYRDMFRSEDFMTRGFINGILDDSELAPSFRDGARIQRLISAAVKSHESGSRVEVDSITE